VNLQLVPQCAEEPLRRLRVRQEAGNRSPVLRDNEPSRPEIVQQGQALLFELGGANGWDGRHEANDRNLRLVVNYDYIGYASRAFASVVKHAALRAPAAPTPPEARLGQ